MAGPPRAHQPPGTDYDSPWKEALDHYFEPCLALFPVVKLLDYAPRYRELESDPNPFAVVVLAHLKALETRRSPAERQAWKVRLVKGLYGRGMGPEDIRQLFRFIDWVLELPKPLKQHFQKEMDAFEEELQMPFLDFYDRRGLRKGLLEGIEVALRMKFGAEGPELMPGLREIYDHEVLQKILHRIETTDSPSALRRYVTRVRRPLKMKPLPGE